MESLYLYSPRTLISFQALKSLMVIETQDHFDAELVTALQLGI
jgi:hypothetical protein